MPYQVAPCMECGLSSIARRKADAVRSRCSHSNSIVDLPASASRSCCNESLTRDACYRRVGSRVTLQLRRDISPMQRRLPRASQHVKLLKVPRLNH